MKTILIVEDDKWLADSYGLTLKHAGYHVLQACNAQDAIELVDEHAIDLILLDIFLPQGNGIQFLQELRSYADTLRTPVIVCTTAAKQLPTGTLEHFGVITILDKTTLSSETLRQSVRDVVLA